MLLLKREHIGEYLKARESSWSPTTLRSETARLSKVSEVVQKGPEALMEHSNSLKPYSRQTLWVRVIDFVDWCIEKGYLNGLNSFKRYRRDNRQVFKNFYQRRHPKVSYQRALSRISNIPDIKTRQAATFILQNGLRACELKTLQDSHVVGKGGKLREIHHRGQAHAVPYNTLYKELQRVGLKPHDLRKIFATEMVARGATEFELTELMGWSSLTPALSYVRVKPSRLKELVK